MIIYHGTDHILKEPKYGAGKPDNDYGRGFYTTEDIEKAREWAVANGSGQSICNKYEIDITGLNVLNLDEYGTLTWIAEIVTNRGTRNTITAEMGAALSKKYKANTSKADIIIGYRADDSYLTVVDAFLENKLSVDEVDRQFRNGDLGEQVFIKSEIAFSRIRFVDYEIVKATADMGNGDIKARQEVIKFLNNRERAINLEGFVPYGITAREAINGDYAYDKEYGFYYPCKQQEKAKGGDCLEME